jgi:hypothetical protein
MFFNCLLANWFNYLKPTIKFKTFTKVKIIHLALLFSCKKWVCKMKCNLMQTNTCMNHANNTNIS